MLYPALKTSAKVLIRAKWRETRAKISSIPHLAPGFNPGDKGFNPGNKGFNPPQKKTPPITEAFFIECDFELEIPKIVLEVENLFFDAISLYKLVVSFVTSICKCTVEYVVLFNNVA